jgi:hypothetical protein
MAISGRLSLPVDGKGRSDLYVLDGRAFDLHEPIFLLALYVYTYSCNLHA